MAILKNTTISGTGHLTLPVAATDTRPATTTTVIRWTNTGTQAVSVLTGTTPTLTTTSWTAPTGVNQVEVLVVAGGGGGGSDLGGGGGAGGLIYTSAFTVTPGTPYTVTVGAGGAGGGSTRYSNSRGTNGSNSVFGSLTAIGGGGGGAYWNSDAANDTGKNGGSGGGNGARDSTIGTATGQATAGQGFNGGLAGFNPSYTGGGGGGAGGPGSNAIGSSYGLVGGGIGLNFSITGTPTWYAGGGGGSNYHASSSNTAGGRGGLGGGGNGGYNITSPQRDGIAGTASTGGGGGGGSWTGSNPALGGAGGSGVVVIRYTVANDNTDPRGQMRYNRELRDVEFYNDNINQWSQQNPAENFAFHNLLPYSQDFTTWNGNYFSNWINSNVTLGQADPFGGTGAGLFTGYYGKFSTSISVQPNKTYTFSVWLKNNALVNPVIVHIVRGLNGAQQGDVSLSVPIASITNWTRVSLSYTVPASGINQVQPGVAFGSSMSASASGYSVLVYGGMLEESTTVGSYVATNATPNPVPTQFGDYRIHTYTATGTSSFVAAATGTVEVLVVGGGGSGGSNHAGGGGGGGVVYNANYPVISGVSYPVVVGGGGTPSANSSTNATNGGKSQFGSIVAAGGGAGGNRNDSASTSPGQGGGSGGGGGGAQSAYALNYQAGPGIPGQGNYGGVAVDVLGGGGGGAGGVGQDGTRGGRGGHGLLFDISGSPTYYGAGGGGGYSGGGTGVNNGGMLGGGYGGYNAGDAGTVGTANTGGGGGGGGAGGQPGSAGGSGIVIVRYRYK